MHFYVIFFLDHAITIVFLFCSFIRMFVRKRIAVTMRAKKEVEEQPISGQKTRLRAGVQVHNALAEQRKHDRQ